MLFLKERITASRAPRPGFTTGEGHATSSTMGSSTQARGGDGTLLSLADSGYSLTARIATDVNHHPQGNQPALTIERAGNVFNGINNGENWALLAHRKNDSSSNINS
jgi:hypothetical protein